MISANLVLKTIICPLWLLHQIQSLDWRLHWRASWGFETEDHDICPFLKPPLWMILKHRTPYPLHSNTSLPRIETWCELCHHIHLELSLTRMSAYSINSKTLQAGTYSFIQDWWNGLKHLTSFYLLCKREPYQRKNKEVAYLLKWLDWGNLNRKLWIQNPIRFLLT